MEKSLEESINKYINNCKNNYRDLVNVCIDHKDDVGYDMAIIEKLCYNYTVDGVSRKRMYLLTMDHNFDYYNGLMSDGVSKRVARTKALTESCRYIMMESLAGQETV